MATQVATPYEMMQVVQEGPAVSICRVLDSREGRSVLLKIQRTRNAAEGRETELLRTELEVGSSVDPSIALRPLAMSTFAGSTALVLEDFGGRPLEQLMGAPMDVGLALRIGARLAFCLDSVHRAGFVHRDIKPQNVFFDARTGEVKLTGFGIARAIPGEYWGSDAAIEGTFPYMSPEQTGQLNRPIDARSDLYSVGVVLYEMLSGVRPFAPHDAVGWVHSHVAQAPMPLVSVPRPVSDIVLKLLKKLPEERYQTAAGLRDDLTRCLEEWEAKGGAVSSFVLGRHDFSHHLRIPKRLYGREHATAVLANAFQRMTARGVPGVVLVMGPDGAGKSSFARSIDEQVVRANGLFIAGKFEQTKRPEPYSAIASALTEVVSYILAEGETGLREWRARFAEALGDFGQLLVDLVRPLERIIGKQPAVPDLPLEGAQNRFYLVVRRFFSALATSDRPLVLFLDDLQWADVASIDLVEHLVTQPETGHLLLLGAYCDTDIAPGHPLLSFAQRMRDRNAVDEIVLTPLTLESVTRLCADTLCSSPERVEPLARLVWERTDGNPLGVTQLLTNLHRDRVLVFDRGQRAWRWNLELVGGGCMHDDAVARTVARVLELPRAMRDELELAACLGGNFDARILCVVTGVPVEETRRALREAVGVGILSSVGPLFRFLHDRIREAIYEGIPRDRRVELHARIGRSLRDHLGREELERRAFDVAAQLNLGAPLITDARERAQVADLDLLAGRTAKASSAYAAGASYCAAGTRMLDASAWEERYDLALGLHLEWARCELLQGHWEEARRLTGVVLSHARSATDCARAHRLQIDIHLFQEEAADAVVIAIESLRALGVDLSPHPTRESLLAAELEVWEALRGRPIESLACAPLLHDPVLEATLETLAAVLPVAYVTDPDLNYLAACRIVALSLRHGMASPSALGCATFAMQLLSTRGRPLEGRKFGEVALRLARMRDFLPHSARTLAIHAGFIAPRTGSLTTALDLQRSAYRAAIEVGDLIGGCFAGIHILETRLARGDHLDDVEREARTIRDRAECLRSFSYALTLRYQLAFIRNLQSRATAESPERAFAGTDLDEEKLKGRTRQAAISRAWFHVRRLQALCLRGDHQGAVDEAARAFPLLWSLTGQSILTVYHLYAVLAHAALASDAAEANREAHVQELSAHQDALAGWAEGCPENFLYMHALVSAERSRLAGDAGGAIRLYEQAIRSAHDNLLSSGEALSYETASSFYRGLGLQTFADTYLRDARGRYLAWGAHAKVRALDEQAPHLIHVQAPSALTATVSTRGRELDQVSVLKVSQVLSSETVRSRLLLGLTQLLSEHAGARRAVFLSVRGERWAIESAAGPDGGVPESIVNRVFHSRERLLVQDARIPGPYSTDPYVIARRPRSIVCLPIVRHAKLLGMVYMDNDLVPAAFTEDKVAVLELLAEQAGISLENANLHSDQLREVAERQEAEAKLRSILDNMVDAVFVCDRSARITFANPAGARLFGFATPNEAHMSVEELAGRVPVVHPDGVSFTPDELPLLRALAGEVLSSVDMTIRSALTGRMAHLRVSAAPLQDERGAIAGAVSVAVNVTEAIELDRLKEQFIRVVAHELKTPVAIVKGYADVLRRMTKEVPESQRRLLGALVRGADRIDRLITALLTLWQLQTGRLVLAVEERVSLTDLVKLVVSRFEFETGRRVSIVAPRPVVVAADRQLLGEALISLVDNALRYSPGGGDVQVEVELLGERAVVTVKDQGIGIPAAKQPHLFELFFRGHADTPYDSGGLGLGLYITRAVAMLHGGSLVAESKEGEGSTFRLTLPLRPAGVAPSRAS
jgi:PAS domain S-box-containing protein